MKLGIYDPPWLKLVAFKFHPPAPPSGRTVNEKPQVYCDKTADRIRMPFGMVSGVGREMSVLDGVHVPQTE